MIAVMCSSKKNFDNWISEVHPDDREGFVCINSIVSSRSLPVTKIVRLFDWWTIPYASEIHEHLTERMRGRG